MEEISLKFKILKNENVPKGVICQSYVVKPTWLWITKWETRIRSVIIFTVSCTKFVRCKCKNNLHFFTTPIDTDLVLIFLVLILLKASKALNFGCWHAKFCPNLWIWILLPTVRVRTSILCPLEFGWCIDSWKIF